MANTRHLTPVPGSGGFDLDAAIRDRRAGKTNFTFTWADRQFELTPMEQLPMDVAEAADTGRLSAVLGALEAGMGTEQYQAFRSTGDIGIDVAEVLVEQWRKHGGLSQGESGASSHSSARTGTPSKRTSSARAGVSRTSRRKAGV